MDFAGGAIPGVILPLDVDGVIQPLREGVTRPLDNDKDGIRDVERDGVLRPENEGVARPFLEDATDGGRGALG